MIENLLTPEDTRWQTFTTALRAAGLPTDDLHEDGQRFFTFDDGAGFGGYAMTDGIALLRSLVVAEAHRGEGRGSAALSTLLDAARHDGAREAWLLTTTASAFFARHGFKPVDRATAPAAVKASPQFSSLCPASAELMCLKLV